jgi:hypothetical protein
VTWLLFCVERRVRNIITLTVTEITAGGMIWMPSNEEIWWLMLVFSLTVGYESHRSNYYVGFEIFTVVIMECNLVERDLIQSGRSLRRFGRIYCASIFRAYFLIFKFLIFYLLSLSVYKSRIWGVFRWS